MQFPFTVLGSLLLFFVIFNYYMVCVETQVQANLILYVPCMMQILTYVTNFFLH